MARRTRPKELSGLFDFWKKKAKEPEQSSVYDVFSTSKRGELIPAPKRPGELIPPKPPPSSVIEVFRPKSQLPARAEPEKREISVFAPKAPGRPAEPAKPMEWAALIPAPPPQEMKPVVEAAQEVFQPTRPPTRYHFLKPSTPPEVQAKRTYEMIVAPQARTEWTLPTVPELAEHFRRTNELDQIWNYIRQARAHPEFRKDQLIASWRGKAIEIPIDPVVYREKYTDFANFYGIPWAVVQSFLNVPPEQAEAADEALWMNLFSPLNAMVPETFETLKPADIPGYFNVSFIEKVDVEEAKKYQKEIDRLQEEVRILTTQLLNLDRSDPRYAEAWQSLRKSIDDRRAALNEWMQALSKLQTIGQYYLLYVEPLLGIGGQGAT